MTEGIPLYVSGDLILDGFKCLKAPSVPRVGEELVINRSCYLVTEVTYIWGTYSEMERIDITVRKTSAY